MYVTWQAKLFVVIAFLLFVLVLVANSLLLNEALRRDLSEVEFYGVGLYVVILFFLFQALRAISKESKMDLGISVALSAYMAVWLTYHLISPSLYGVTLFDDIGCVLSVVAWFSFIFLAVLGYFAGKRFGYRAWNKVGGLIENQSVYEVTANFRSTLRLDTFTVSFACYTAQYYVYESPGLIGSVLFFLWTLAKNLVMYTSIKRGFTSYTRILRLTSFDVLIALVATFVYDYVYHGVKYVSYIQFTYIAVGVTVISTRVVVVVLANRALEEVAQNRQQAEGVSPGLRSLP